MIPKVIEGPFVLKRAVSGKPVLLGNKGLRISYFNSQNWFEVRLNFKKKFIGHDSFVIDFLFLG